MGAVFLRQCVQSCNKDALEMTTKLRAPVGQSGSLTVNIGRTAEGGFEGRLRDETCRRRRGRPRRQAPHERALAALLSGLPGSPY